MLWRLYRGGGCLGTSRTSASPTIHRPTDPEARVQPRLALSGSNRAGSNSTPPICPAYHGLGGHERYAPRLSGLPRLGGARSPFTAPSHHHPLSTSPSLQGRGRLVGKGLGPGTDRWAMACGALPWAQGCWGEGLFFLPSTRDGAAFARWCLEQERWQPRFATAFGCATQPRFGRERWQPRFATARRQLRFAAAPSWTLAVVLRTGSCPGGLGCGRYRGRL